MCQIIDYVTLETNCIKINQLFCCKNMKNAKKIEFYAYFEVILSIFMFLRLIHL